MCQMSVKQSDACNLMVVGMKDLANSRVHELFGGGARAR